MCPEGHDARFPMCAVCESGYIRSGNNAGCEPCKAAEGAWLEAGLVLVGLTVGLLLAIVFTRKCKELLQRLLRRLKKMTKGNVNGSSNGDGDGNGGNGNGNSKGGTGDHNTDDDDDDDDDEGMVLSGLLTKIKILVGLYQARRSSAEHT